MSFGFSVGDFVALTQLAWTTVQNARLATGAHHDLTRELTSLHLVLQRLERQKSKPESLLNKTEDDRRRELTTLLRGCRRLLRRFVNVLEKYNELPNEKRSATSIWQKLAFGNGEMQDLGKMRLELVTHTNAITMFLNLLLLGSQGKVESYFNDQGKDLRELRKSVDWIITSLQAESSEGSVLSSHTDDDKATWKLFRHKLVGQGFRSSLLKKHEKRIMEYALELGRRGVLDGLERLEEADETPERVEDNDQHSFDGFKRLGGGETEVAESDAQHSSDDSGELDDVQDDTEAAKDNEQPSSDGSEGPDESDSGPEALEDGEQHSPTYPSEAVGQVHEYVSSNLASSALSEGTSGNSAVGKAIWKHIRRGLIAEGFSKIEVKNNKTLIIEYFKELDSKWASDSLDKLDGVNRTSKKNGAQEGDHQLFGRGSILSTLFSGGFSLDRSSLAKLKLLQPVHCPQNPSIDREIKPRKQDPGPDDAARFNIDPLCRLNHWDSSEEPIKLFGSIFDLKSICDWISDAASIYDKMQFSRPRERSTTRGLATQRASILRVPLLKLYGRLRVLRQYLPHVLSTQNRRIVQGFLARGSYIFDYFQENLTAAQYVVLGLKVQRLVGKTRDDDLVTDFLDHDGISKWEMEPVEIIGTRAVVDLIWFIFNDVWDDVSYFISEGLGPWITQVEKDCLSIVREAHTESLRVPTPEEQAAKALVIYQWPKNDERGLILYEAAKDNDPRALRLQLELASRQTELKENSRQAEQIFAGTAHALREFKTKNRHWPENATPDQFQVFGRLVAAEEAAYAFLGKERRHFRTSSDRLNSDYVLCRDHLILGRKPCFPKRRG